MTFHLRAVKTSLIIGLLLFSVIAAIIPATSARLLGNNINVRMEYDAVNASEKIVPLSGEISIPINVYTKLEGVTAAFLIRLLGAGLTVSIDLKVLDTPTWITAWVSPNVVTPDISISWQPAQAYVHVSFNENAPAHESVIIDIEMHAYVTGGIRRIEDKTTTAQISFVPSYLPIIDATPKTTYKEISPGEIVAFDIDLENLGNAETEFLFNVIEVPEGWSASIVSNTKVGSKIDGDDPTKTVQLFVQPPYNFGYHNEREDIRITVKGRYFAGAAGVLETVPYEITFTVQSRGFSTPGFEAALALFALIIVALLIKKRKKIG